MKSTQNNSIVKSISLRFRVEATNGFYRREVLSRSGWTHVVINYIGPQNEQGIKIYFNGVRRRTDPTMDPHSYGIGNGHVVIGRYHTDIDDRYASVELDELIFFNKKLSESEITMLSQF